MSKRVTRTGAESRWPACEETGKFRYPSRSGAHRAVKKASYRVRVYECRHCWGWHVTRSEGRRGKI